MGFIMLTLQIVFANVIDLNLCCFEPVLYISHFAEFNRDGRCVV